jgi:hypothetical protein
MASKFKDYIGEIAKVKNVPFAHVNAVPITDDDRALTHLRQAAHPLVNTKIN